MEANNDLSTELNPELLQSMKNLFIVLNGEEDSWDTFFQDETEGHFFDITGDKSEIEKIALKCGLQLVFCVLEPSKPDLDEPIRNYTVIGVTFSGSLLQIVTGLDNINDVIILELTRDYPEELIFLAVEMNPDIVYRIEGAPQEEDHLVEIYINKMEDIVTISN